MTKSPDISIIIPAHNEAKIIGRSLNILLDEAGQKAVAEGEWQVILIANGCDDDTAEIVRAQWPKVQVIELDQASKTTALRAGADAAKGSSWVVMDADIELRSADVITLVAGLEAPESSAALGEFMPDLSGASIAVRLFYRAWRHHPYFDGGKFGGCYALPARYGDALLSTIPDVTNDDEWIARQARGLGNVVKTSAHIATKAPRNLADLIRVRRRVYQGNKQLENLASQSAKSPGSKASSNGLIRRLIRRPNLWLAGLCFVGVNALAKLSGIRQRDAERWEQAERY